MQWDFGQPGRGEAAAEMLRHYSDWAPTDQGFTQTEQTGLLRRLQTRGQVGNDLSAKEQDRLNEFLRSDDGRMFVQDLNAQQVERKWQAVGQPLSEIGWLRDLNRTYPDEAAEIVAVTSKLYNQNQARGELLVGTLQQSTGMTPESVREWIGNQGINGLNPAARAAITSGRDATVRGVSLVNALELGSGPGSEEWRTQVGDANNPALARGFNSEPSLQLFDAMLRDPVIGARILGRMDTEAAGPPLVIAGANELARAEISQVRVDRQGHLSVTDPSGEMHIWNGRSWASALERTDPIYHRGAHPFGPPAPLTLDSPALPPIFAQCVERVHALDPSLGRSPDERSDRAAACLATEAMANGLTRVDHVMLSTATPSLQAGHHLFAVQGSPSNPAHMRAHVETEVAINTPIEVSVQRGLDLQQEQLTQQQRMQPNTGTATPGTGDRIDGDTGLVFPSCSPIRSQPLARRVHSYRMKVTQPAGDRAQRITPINRRPTPGSVTM
ncbi:hypothetical protein GUF72_01925 [Xanthomonas citri pv. citri]|uniref:X-Tfes XVIPCD domain-containing protein n=3 Tax=Xanthomonas citri TaxID=346 RepID=A0A0U5BPN0_XANCI|nr:MULTISPECIES: XVIPCD domain-containing protein [Xanthomonas]AJD67353.1 hypothetical protein J151_00885 [Xanthomonas citri subsp. citri A306]AJY80887.1 hypothetical protein J159_00882 [Xanthomonas citri pv. citri]AJY85309.1 hypothetical protein J158_00882 [Xanthomonas citri subsp. citri UI6]AJY89732.1 hypothetical protein J169_00881 [Xanthomonas citri pv. citri]AJY94203.1 hypothetical protein J164_00881 [Xanthomonas citri pv. citri]